MDTQKGTHPAGPVGGDWMETASVPLVHLQTQPHSCSHSQGPGQVTWIGKRSFYFLSFSENI